MNRKFFKVIIKIAVNSNKWMSMIPKIMFRAINSNKNNKNNN